MHDGEEGVSDIEQFSSSEESNALPSQRKLGARPEEHVKKEILPNSHLVLTGDFNCYGGILDKMGGWVSTDARLSDLKSVYFIRDA